MPNQIKCPFCGRKAKVRIQDDLSDIIVYFAIIECQSPALECGVTFEGPCCKTKKEAKTKALAAWELMVKGMQHAE